MKTAFLILSMIISSSSYAEGRNLPVLKDGVPALKTKARELTQKEISSTDTQQLIDDLIVTNIKIGGVGLAAPQVNQSLRIFVMQLLPVIPLTIVINPKIEPIETAGKTDSEEACHSLSGRYLKVKRFKKIKLSYFNRNGEFVTEEVEGYKAIIVQHEFDHLNGVLTSDKALDAKGELNWEKYFSAARM